MTRMKEFSGTAFFALTAVAMLPTGGLAQGENNGSASASAVAAEMRTSELRQLSVARSLMQAKQWDNAIDAFTKAAAASSNDVAAAARAGLSHTFALKMKSSDDEAAEASARNLRLGQAFLDAGDWDKAIATLTEVTASENVSLAELRAKPACPASPMFAKTTGGWLLAHSGPPLRSLSRPDAGSPTQSAP